ncbi:MAG: hypothetical protein ACYC7E_16320 [Armatimonadota bacterium]
MPYRLFVSCLILLGGMVLASAAERQLAGIRIGMRPDQVKAVLGEPTATIVAQPPFETRTPGMDQTMMGGMMGMPGVMPGMPEVKVEKPNTLIFVLTRTGQETEIAPAASEMGGGMAGMPDASGMAAASGTPSKIPTWAYPVRVSKLSLDQIEYIYRLNNTYIVGVVITGQGAEARVTDIIGCSFLPMIKYFDKPGKRFNPEQMDFYCTAVPGPAKGKYFPAGTSKGVLIGSSFEKVLRAHKWPDYFFPFLSSEVASYRLNKNPSFGELNINNRSVLGTAGETAGAKPGDTPGMGPMMPPPGMSPAPGMFGTPGGDMEQAYGEKPVLLTDGDQKNLNIGFTKDCELLYLADEVALTIVNFTVVRIQIGKGVTKPPAPKAPTMSM